MFDWYWPVAKTEAGGVARLGRVLHWTCAGLGALVVMVALFIVVSSAYGSDSLWIALGSILGGALFAMLGRAFRYILSGE